VAGKWTRKIKRKLWKIECKPDMFSTFEWTMGSRPGKGETGKNVNEMCQMLTHAASET